MRITQKNTDPVSGLEMHNPAAGGRLELLACSFDPVGQTKNVDGIAAQAEIPSRDGYRDCGYTAESQGRKYFGGK